MAIPQGQRLSLPIVGAFGSTAAPIAAIALVMGVYLPRFFTSYIGLTLGAVGLAFTVVRLLDMGLDPLLGLGMDRTRSRFGRYRLRHGFVRPDVESNDLDYRQFMDDAERLRRRYVRLR